MKKLAIFAILCAVMCVGFVGISEAGSFGNVRVLSIVPLEKEYVVFASEYGYYGMSSQCNECVQTDERWPAGTQYAFWFPKVRNQALYVLFLNAINSGKDLYLDADLEDLNYGPGIHCKINVSKGVIYAPR